MISDNVNTLMLQLLEEKTGGKVEVRGSRPVGGGCINEAMRVDTTAGVFFLKHNDAKRYPGMFEAEAKGLMLLGEASGGALAVPAVVAHGADDRLSLLLLEYLEQGMQKKGFWEAFGTGLARLHQNSHDRFGLDHPNYIGSLPQSNRMHDAWEAFFINERLEPQIKMARDSGQAGRELTSLFERLYPRLNDFFPEEPPALLHGDLWSGNYMTGPQGEPAIIDPAVYYGHRYMDLGMSLLFGGFSGAFYEAYNEAFPMEKSWRSSMDIANLYPLMVHVNLFGGGYLGSVKRTLQRFR